MSQDPEEAGVDWGYTGYGTGDPNATGFLSKLGKWMPLIVAGIFTAGTLQSMGLLPGMSSAEAAQADAAIGAGAGGSAAGGIAPGVITNTAPDIGAAISPGAYGGWAPGTIAGGALDSSDIPLASTPGAAITNGSALGTGLGGIPGVAPVSGVGTIPGVTLPGGLVGGGTANSLIHALGGGGGAAALLSTIPALLASQQAKSPLDNPQVQQLLNMSIQRQQRTDPLHQAVTQLSMSMLPTAVQK